jgi:protoporphyrin/coproporphyrin ferrochelatase
MFDRNLVQRVQIVEKVGVLLMNLGGPEKQDDVRPFLYNLFADPEIIRIPIKPLQKPLAWVISTARATKSQKNYAAIGGGSPLKAITNQQGRVLKKALAARGIDAQIYLGMRYWHPFVAETLAQVKKDGITQLVALPLYPHYSISTSGSSLKELEQLWAQDPALQKIRRIDIGSWYARPGYVRAMAGLIRQALAKCDRPKEVQIFFSAHGVPKTYVTEDGDPYQKEIEDSVRLIINELALPNAFTLAYQSKVGPVEWLKPYTEDSIVKLAQGGTKSLLMVPISFVSEHIETLQEIDIEYKEVAEEAGIHDFHRVRALNIDATFINDLADMVCDKLGAGQVV